ncbi:hypothetical protein QCA50_018845 [Cerrena zonata]|uniref:DUF171-domain-containing protein n=1 Tax=Cerrena zonata TaxID=2478898 RepID=A0AAW0FFX6_9APHY
MAKRKSESVPDKPTKKPSKSLKPTRYSLCVPSSIISNSNAYNLEQITNIAYQIAKTATIYDVAEIVILDIPTSTEKHEQKEKELTKVVELGSDKGGKRIKFNFNDDEVKKEDAKEKPKEVDEALEPTGDDIKNENNSILFASLLQYFITPPYLINSTFANNKYKSKFKYAHKLPKLSTLPFMQNNGVGSDFKEGLTVAKHTPKITNKKTKKKTSQIKKLSVTKYVNIGEDKLLELSQDVPVNVRVTVDVKNKKIVSPLTAYGTIGNRSSFGYFVRLAKTFSSLFTESSFPDGYTASVYANAGDYFNRTPLEVPESVELSKINVKGGQVLIVVGQLDDINYSFTKDQSNLSGIEGAHQMFDGKLDLPNGVRVEDGALIALTKLN